MAIAENDCQYDSISVLVSPRLLLADTASKPYEWRKLGPKGEGPTPCMYFSYFRYLIF